MINGSGMTPFNQRFNQRPPTPFGQNQVAGWNPVLRPMSPSLQAPFPTLAAADLDSKPDVPPPNDDLQEKYPGRPARLGKGQLLPSPKLGETMHTLGQVAHNKPVKDSELATLDDNMKRLGSAGIALLATMGLRNRVLGIPEFMGGASWFAAMAATPSVINGMVRMKTGVNLNQQYDSSYGHRTNLYTDPNYLPLHILPDETINKVADRLKVPQGPTRRTETEEKMRQISVQTHTWWMLAAGPATPVISGLLCDSFQEPAMRAFNWAGLKASSFRAKGAHDAKTLEAFNKHTDAYLSRLIGDLPESERTSWWKDFSVKITEKSGLRDAFKPGEVLDVPRYKLEKDIEDYLCDPDRKGRRLSNQQVTDTLNFLDRQFKEETVNGKSVKTGKLAKLEERANNFIESFREPFEKQLEGVDKNSADAKLLREKLAALDVKSKDVKNKIANASSTVEHFRGLFQTVQESFVVRESLKNDKAAYKKHLDDIREQVKHKMNITAQKLGDMTDAGKLGTAQKSMPKWLFNMFTPKHTARRYQLASHVMGANPKGHLVRSLNDVMARSRWQTRMFGWLGGSLLLASAVYTGLFVGKDFNAGKKPGGTA